VSFFHAERKKKVKTDASFVPTKGGAGEGKPENSHCSEAGAAARRLELKKKKKKRQKGHSI